MELKVYDRNRQLRVTFSPDSSSQHHSEIGGDDYISLSCTYYECVTLEVGDFVIFQNEKFRITESYTPKQEGTGKWVYSVKFYGAASIIKDALMLNPDGTPVFVLTAPAREHLALVVTNLNRWMNTSDWKAGICVSTENIVIDYSEGVYCNEALKQIADGAGTEWWIEGTTVNISRCERGEEITLAYGKGLRNIERGNADNVKFFTRLFPIGSTKNIDAEKYGYGMLQLPSRNAYVERNTEYGTIEHYEKEAFNDIFPRRTGTVSSVRSEAAKNDDGKEFTIYHFSDSGLDFDPNKYEIASLVKHVVFQDGELAGRDFEVNYDSSKKEFEIITTWPYDDDTQLPGGLLVPKTGNKYILYNIQMPSEYYPLAEKEYETAVNKFMDEHSIDRSVYKSPTDYTYIKANGIDLMTGQRVRLESGSFFPKTGYRSSRITVISQSLLHPGQADIEISDVLSQTSQSKMTDELQNIRTEVRTATTTFPDIIRSWESTFPTDSNIYSARAVLKKIAQLALSRLNPDESKSLIKFLDGLESGVYKEGLSGARIDKEGNAELAGLVTRLRAVLAELQVNGAASFHGNLSSEEFISGFTGGKGWGILKKEVLNALGVPERKYVGEFDEIVVRGVMRIFSLVVSQLIGENDNRIFTGMMEVDHYDASTGRIYLDTRNGKLYNPFRADDYIMVQQYNGLPSEDNSHCITKHYELIVTGAGCGSSNEGEERLDWVTFRNFVSADGRGMSEVISKGDTLTRVDNATDADRKGIIQIITVGSATPYMDITYGMKTDPDNALKGRLGNLTGVRHHLFGWLEGFGELLTNLYAVGDFRLHRTGESVDSKIEMLKGSFASNIQHIAYELTEEDNYLKNATFAESMDSWSHEDESSIITSNGEALLMNGSTFVMTGKVARIEEYDGRNMLHIHGSRISQANAHIRKPGTHKEYKNPTDGNVTDEYTEVMDTLYLSVKLLARTDGVLTIGMKGASNDADSLPLSTVSVTGSMDWQILQWSGTWNGAGEFVLEYTGDAYVSLLSLTDSPLADYKKEVSTRIEQTSTNIRLLGTNINNLKGTVTGLGIDLDAANERISIYAKKVDTLEGTVTSLGIRLDAAESNITLYATKTGNNESAISVLQIKTDSIVSTVTSVQGDLEQAKSTAAAASKAAQDKANSAYSYADEAWSKAWNAQNTADNAYNKAVSNATAISQTDSAVSILAGRFTADGELVNTSGLLTTAYGNALYSEIYDINGKLASKAEISTSVQFDANTGIVTSDIMLSADKIDLTGMVVINCSIRSPFQPFNKRFTFQDKEYTYDNIFVAEKWSSSDGTMTYWSSDTEAELQWDYTQIGRTVCLSHFNPDSYSTIGRTKINAPSGKYFYEDGFKRSRINISREVVILKGLGKNLTFWGWAVIRRSDISTTHVYGREVKSFAQGIVTGTSSGASMKYSTTAGYNYSGWPVNDDGSTDSAGNPTYDSYEYYKWHYQSYVENGVTKQKKVLETNPEGKNIVKPKVEMTVQRMSQGVYRITFPSGWNCTSGNYYVMLTGIGYSYDDSKQSSPVKATVKSLSSTYFDVWVSDDATVNDGSFAFQMISTADWYVYDDFV